MKKTLVAIAALAAFGAQAQSSVSIDGIVNYGMANSVAKQATVGGWKGDRNVLNFKIVEDLGQGNNVGLQLQNRFDSGTAGNKTTYVNSATGAAGDSVFEQQKITVNTSSFGQVAVGRFTNAQGVADLHPFEDAAQSTAPHQAVNGRLSGQFQYTSPSFAGAQLWVLNAKASSNKYMGSGTGGGYDAAWILSNTNTSANAGADSRHTDLRAFGINYANGPLFVQVNTMTDLLNVRSQKIGATYDFGVAKVYVNNYNQKDNISLAYAVTAAGTQANGSLGGVAASVGNGLAAHKANEIAVKAPYGKFNFIAGYLKSSDNILLSGADSKVEKKAYGVTYDISKRTQLQAYASTVKNGDTSATGATVNNGGFANGHNSFFGMQHSF